MSRHKHFGWLHALTSFRKRGGPRLLCSLRSKASHDTLSSLVNCATAPCRSRDIVIVTVSQATTRTGAPPFTLSNRPLAHRPVPSAQAPDTQAWLHATPRARPSVAAAAFGVAAAGRSSSSSGEAPAAAKWTEPVQDGLSVADRAILALARAAADVGNKAAVSKTPHATLAPRRQRASAARLGPADLAPRPLPARHA